MDEERFSVYVALDGTHLDGLNGSAGILRFDWPEKKYYLQHYPGVSAAHNPNLSPNGELALLGNFSQQIVLIDVRKPNDLKLVTRQSTICIEECSYKLRSTTHHLWYPDNRTFLAVVGDNVYRFHIDRLREPESLGPHYLENAHEIRWDSSRRYLLIGDLGGEHAPTRRIAVFDLEEPDPQKRSRVIQLPGTVWHCCVHPKKAVGYALTYSFATEDEEFFRWSPAYTREYIFEVDLPSAKTTRIWSCGPEYPIHLNSDIGVTEDNLLYVASGGSHTVVEINLDNFTDSRVLPCVPPWWLRILTVRQQVRNFLGAFSRRRLVDTHFILQTLQVTGWRYMDGIYAARVSPQGKYLITASRGYNVLSVYDRRTFKKIYSKMLPWRRDIYHGRPQYRIGWWGYHLGFHHSDVSPR